MNYADV